jgi:hypothetical protein
VSPTIRTAQRATAHRRTATGFRLAAAACISAAGWAADAAAQAPAANAARSAAPAAVRPAYAAIRAPSSVRVDGRLDDPAWRAAPVASGFRTVEPTEGDPARFPTEVRVVYDAEALYVGAFLRDSLGARGLRVQDLRRKFDYFQNDLFGVSFDALHDGRTVAAFQVTPYGAQRELQVFDDAFYNREWEAVWRVRTQVTDSGWTAEIAIPWASLRYRADGAPWAVNFYRIARRANETSAWAPWPRAFTAYRVPYFGTLGGLAPPPPRRGEVRLRPYVLAQGDARGAAANDPRTGAAAPSAATTVGRVGGEVTWAPTPNAVVDVTANTDFAQAEVDRQVVNTTRFSVFFPERRQFFLEGGTLFDVGPSGLPVKPFFSRRIGLDPGGTPVPIQAGARYVRRDARGGDGLLVMRQDAGPTPGRDPGAATFAVARASRNLGASGRLGVLAAGRDAAAGPPAFAGTDSARGAPRARDAVVALDGFTRLGQAVALDGMVSASSASGGRGPGFAAFGNVFRSTRTLNVGGDVYLVTRDYDPPTGFVARRDVLRTSGTVGYNWRPAWRPKGVRYFYPYAGTFLYSGAGDRRLQETFSEVWVDVFFDNGALVYPALQHFYQRTTAPFAPVRGVTVAPGAYPYWRGEFLARTDQSARWGASAKGSTGAWFDRRLEQATLTGRAAVSPRAALGVQYDVNHFRGAPPDSLGARAPDVTTHLVAPELRLALNPRVQFTTFYQYNTDAARGALNARFSWEFAPLSYVYVVVNDLRAAGPDARTAGPRAATRQVVLKAVWLRPL